jgi:D-alanine-D-alanine ligase
MTYPDERTAEETEKAIKEVLGRAFRWRLEKVGERPAMVTRKHRVRPVQEILKVAKEWEISIRSHSSAMPSVAGLVPATTAVVCGLGPVCRDIYTQHESVGRSSLMKRTLLLAQYLLSISR